MAAFIGGGKLATGRALGHHAIANFFLLGSQDRQCLRLLQLQSSRFGIDLVRRDDSIGQHGHHVSRDLYKTTIDVVPTDFVTDFHTHFAETKPPDQGA